MRVNAASRIAKIEGIPEQRCASRFFEVHGGPSEKYSVGMGRGRHLRVWKDKYMGRLDALLLDSGWCDEYLVTAAKFVPKLKIVHCDSYPTRIQIPPPVPVTHPSYDIC
jgi:hypothetical protein